MRLGDLVTFLGETRDTHARIGIVIGFNHFESRAKILWLAYNSVKWEPAAWLKTVTKSYRVS